jgi:hypothetical protein
MLFCLPHLDQQSTDIAGLTFFRFVLFATEYFLSRSGH